MTEHGPIYNVRLINILCTPDQSAFQPMPNRAELEVAIADGHEQLVAAYESLLAAYESKQYKEWSEYAIQAEREHSIWFDNLRSRIWP